MKNIPIQFKIVLGLVFIILIGSQFSKVYNTTKTLFNSTKEIELEYEKVTQLQVSNYDGYYLAFKDKQENANINKEVFITITDIIMSNRADGEQVSWKWLQENQQIPYEEFTIFYKELSSFIKERYVDNMNIEAKKQSLVNEHNKLLVIYPNNIINKVLKIKPIVYKQGYISNNTKELFNNIQ